MTSTQARSHSGANGAPAFADDFTATFQRLRAALTEVFASVEADASRPQEVARRFGLNKNLTWKLSKITSSYNGGAGVQHLPGPAGMTIFLRAMESNGASDTAVQGVRTALDDFDRMVSTHAGSRATLELMVGGISPKSLPGEALEQSRKLAFQGNSGTWAVQANLQMASFILAPSAEDPNFVDLAHVAALVGFRRLRPGVRWPLFQRRAWRDDGDDWVDTTSREHPLDPNGANGVPLIEAFCSAPLPKLEMIRIGAEAHYELPAGPVGNTGALTCTYGTISRKAGPAFRDETEPFVDLGANLNTPVEMLQLDMLVHDSLVWAMEPQPSLFSRMDGSSVHDSAVRARNRLPVLEEVQEQGRGIAPLSTSQVPRYTLLMKYVFDQLDWDPDRFVSFRFSMAYPPIPTAVLLRSELPERP